MDNLNYGPLETTRLCLRHHITITCSCADCVYERIIKQNLYNSFKSRDEILKNLFSDIEKAFNLKLESNQFDLRELPKGFELLTVIQQRVYKRLMNDLYNWYRD